MLENFYLCGIKHNKCSPGLTSCVVVICLKISIFVVSNTTICGRCSFEYVLWFAWKFLSLWYQTQPLVELRDLSSCCDLLENFYLCGIKHNSLSKISLGLLVVICLKISIFVVSNTTRPQQCRSVRWLWFAWKFLSLWYQTQPWCIAWHSWCSCDLLENFYLCGIKHNEMQTITAEVLLWFAWKFLSLWYQTQPNCAKC